MHIGREIKYFFRSIFWNRNYYRVFVLTGLVLGAVLIGGLSGYYIGKMRVNSLSSAKSESEIIAARWTGNPIRLSARDTVFVGAHPNIIDTSYLRADANGTMWVVTPSAEVYSKLVLDLRAKIDATVERYETDETVPEFMSAVIKDDYTEIVVQTYVKQSSLIRMDSMGYLLRLLSLQDTLYNGDSSGFARIYFVNSETKDNVVAISP